MLTIFSGLRTVLDAASTELQSAAVADAHLSDTPAAEALDAAPPSPPPPPLGSFLKEPRDLFDIKRALRGDASHRDPEMKRSTLKQEAAGAAVDRDAELTRHKSLKEQARDTVEGAAGELSVDLGPQQVNRLLRLARFIGISETEVRKLEEILVDSDNFAADAQLVEKLLLSANAERAICTFNDLDVYRRQHPDRITRDIVETLTLGVGTERSGDAKASEGILGGVHAINAAEALVHMPKSDYDRIKATLANAGQPNLPGTDAQLERALILKAVGARRDLYADGGHLPGLDPTAGIERFAEAIRAGSRSFLIQRTTAIDLWSNDTDEALQQRFTNSCVEATVQIARAEADPIYAWNLHREELHSTSTHGAIAEEQRNQLLHAGAQPAPRSMTGDGTPYTELTAIMNDTLSPTSGRTYAQYEVLGDDNRSPAQARRDALDHIETIVRGGTDVPIEAAWPREGSPLLSSGSHMLLITDVRGAGANREFLVTDPWFGHTGWVKGTDIVNGKTNFFANTGTLVSYWA